MQNNPYFYEALRVLHDGTRPHYVYFIMATPHDDDSILDMRPLVKIGTSTDVEARMRSLLRGDNTKGADWLNEYPAACLSLLGYVEGDRELESLLHKAFSKHRADGEWFWYDPIAETLDEILDGHCCCDPCRYLDTVQQLPVEVQRELLQPVWDALGLSTKAAQ